MQNLRKQHRLYRIVVEMEVNFLKLTWKIIQETFLPIFFFNIESNKFCFCFFNTDVDSKSFFRDAIIEGAGDTVQRLV